jgi:hypothetical protein
MISNVLASSIASLLAPKDDVTRLRKYDSAFGKELFMGQFLLTS